MHEQHLKEAKKNPKAQQNQQSTQQAGAAKGDNQDVEEDPERTGSTNAMLEFFD